MSKTLKEIIDPLHRRAEQMEFTQRMMRGELSTEEYVMYLYQLQRIFRVIEYNYDLPHPSLNRLEAVMDDIRELVADNPTAVEELPFTSKYIRHLKMLNERDVMAHVYLNYLALMFGGQMMKSKVPGSGRVYHFENVRDALQSVRDIQHEGWGHEANIGLLFNIGVLDELQSRTR